MKTEILKKLWKKATLSWAIIRTEEVELLSLQNFKHPILEVGCGDGLVTSITFKNKKNAVDIGVDLDAKELQRAKKTGVYKKLLLSDITATNFDDNTFNTIFANGVLEHIPNLKKALFEISRILKKNGRLITTSPTNNYTKLLFYYRLFSFFRIPQLAIIYGKIINRLFLHNHLLNQKQWEVGLNKADLTMDFYQYYNNSYIILIHDLFLPLSALTKILKKYTNSNIFFPKFQYFLVNVFTPIINKFSKNNINKYQNNASIFIIAIKN